MSNDSSRPTATCRNFVSVSRILLPFWCVSIIISKIRVRYDDGLNVMMQNAAELCRLVGSNDDQLRTRLAKISETPKRVQ